MTTQRQYFTAIIGNVTCLYPHIFVPGQAKLPNGKLADPRYKIDWLVPKADMSCMNDALAAARNEFDQKFPGQGDAFQQALQNAFRDGDVPKPGKSVVPHEAGHFVFAASNNADHRPTVFDAKGQPLLDAAAVYSGCVVHLDVQASAGSHPTTGQPFVKFYLNQVMKVKDGPRLGGGGANPAAFAAVMPSQSEVNPFAQYL
jgi:hypothetical protein